MYHPFGAAIKPGGNSLRQWGNLRDAHFTVSLCSCMKASPPPAGRPTTTRGTFPHLRSSPHTRRSSTHAFLVRAPPICVTVNAAGLLHRAASTPGAAEGTTRCDHTHGFDRT